MLFVTKQKNWMIKTTYHQNKGEKAPARSHVSYAEMEMNASSNEKRPVLFLLWAVDVEYNFRFSLHRVVCIRYRYNNTFSRRRRHL